MDACERWARAERRASRPRLGSLAAVGADSDIGVLGPPDVHSACSAGTLRQRASNLNPKNPGGASP